MKNLITALFILFSVTCFAQSKKIATLSGNIPKMAGDSIRLDNLIHSIIKIPVDDKGNFHTVIKVDSGSYYSFNGSYVYLEPQMDLAINKPVGIYA